MKDLHQEPHSGEAVSHWWKQRLTAIALIPLSLWFVISLLLHVNADYQHFILWLRTPWTATLMILFLVSLFYHGYLGIQVVVEDYVPHLGWRVFWLIFCKFMCVGVALLSIVSVLLIVLRG